MRFAFGSFALIAAFACTVPAIAGPDDAKWIARCLQDNANAKDSTGKAIPVEVLTKYCTCMNNKMSNNETRTITQWEKANPRAQEACSKEAGWGR